MIRIEPEIPDQPNIILIGERPGREELAQGRPFVGPAGQLLRKIVVKTGARPVIVNAVNTYSEEKPTTDEINYERESILIPLFERFHSLPIVALGAYAAQAVYKGKRGEGSMAGKALWLHGRPVLFTYHPSYWFYTKPFPKDDRILEHIEIHIATALRGEHRPKYLEGRLPKDVNEIVVDTENDSEEYPWYNSQTRIVGIMPVGFIPYIVRADQLTDEDKHRLATDTRRVIGHNLLYDLLHLASQGISFPLAELHDTLIYDRYVHGGELDHGHDLKFLGKKRLLMPAWETKARQWWEDGGTTKDMPQEIIYPYNAGDLYATEGLYNLQRLKLPLFDLDMDYLKNVVLPMVQNGLYISKRKMQMIGKEVLNEKNRLESKFKRVARVGRDFNPRSPKQLNSLFARSGISVPNTQEDTLTPLKDRYPMIQVLLDYKKEEKFYNTGVEGLVKRITAEGLIHSSFGVTETSRLKSSRPNIQNLDPRIRTAVRSRYKGGWIIHPDLSQLEYRIIAHASKEMKLIKIFREGGDIHSGMYQYLFGKPAKTKEDRDLAKHENYASVYGEGYPKFLTVGNMPDTKENKALFYKAKKAYPAINEFREDVEHQVKTYHRIKNVFGRIRVFEEPELRDMWSAGREGFNYLFQSAGHDVLDAWIFEVKRLLPDSRILIVADEHDEMIIDTPPEFKKIVMNLVPLRLNDLLYDVFGVQFLVPMIGTMQIGKTWS